MANLILPICITRANPELLPCVTLYANSPTVSVESPDWLYNCDQLMIYSVVDVYFKVGVNAQVTLSDFTYLPRYYPLFVDTSTIPIGERWRISVRRQIANGYVICTPCNNRNI